MKYCCYYSLSNISTILKLKPLILSLNFCPSTDFSMALLDNFLIVESSSLLYTKVITICLKLVYFNLNALDMILFLSFSDSRVILTGLDLSSSSIYFPTLCIFIILDCIFIDCSISLILIKF